MVAAERLEGQELFAHPLAAAVVAEVAEVGYPAAEVAAIVRRAGLPDSDFDALFTDKADAVLRVFEAYIDDFERRLQAAYDGSPGWPASLRAAAYATVAWTRSNPDATRFGMFAVLEAGEMARVRREEVFRWCAGLVEAGRDVAPDPGAVPEAAALIAVGSIVEVFNRDGQGTLETDLLELVPEMMYATVRPYLGEEAARAELAIPPPAELAPPPRRRLEH